MLHWCSKYTKFCFIWHSSIGKSLLIVSTASEYQFSQISLGIYSVPNTVLGAKNTRMRKEVSSSVKDCLRMLKWSLNHPGWGGIDSIQYSLSWEGNFLKAGFPGKWFNDLCMTKMRIPWYPVYWGSCIHLGVSSPKEVTHKATRISPHFLTTFSR